jgi:hypothetical protein
MQRVHVQGEPRQVEVTSSAKRNRVMIKTQHAANVSEGSSGSTPAARETLQVPRFVATVVAN